MPQLKTVLNCFVLVSICLLDPWPAPVTFITTGYCKETNNVADTLKEASVTGIGNDEDYIPSLRLVQVFHRHGDRNPTDTFPTDQYKDEWIYWPEGFGELTQLGRQQMYELGAYLRQRYAGFISDRFNKCDILVTSSDSDRTIMSAQALMAGFYPPINSSKSDLDLEKGQTWNPYMDWQLVPIHTIPSENDSFIRMKAPCPKFWKVYEELYKNSQYTTNVESKHRRLKNFMIKHLGLTSDVNVKDLLKYQDILFIHKLKHRNLPTWLNESIYQELNSLKYFQFTVFTQTTEQKRLRSGPLLQKLVSNIADKINETKNGQVKGMEDESRKMFIYSAHEGTIGDFLNTLGVFNFLQPPYASAIILELHSTPKEPEVTVNPNNGNNSNEQFFVKILYRNDTNVKPYELELPGCSNPCSLEKLLSFLEPIIPTNWERECLLEQSNYLTGSSRQSGNLNFHTPVWLLIGGIIISSMLLAFAISLKCPLCKPKLNEKYETVE